MFNNIPQSLYTAQQTRELDRLTIENHGIPGSTLMARAAEACYQTISKRWSHAKKIAVICGIGNNGGDGFVLARRAKPLGLNMHVYAVGDLNKLSGDALEAYEALQGTAIEISTFTDQDFSQYDLIIDAVFGSGLDRAITGTFKTAVEHINASGKDVLAVDVPSGINSDTGCIMGVAVKACATVCFIGLKRGLFTADGPEHCGEIIFDDLEVPKAVFKSVNSTCTLLHKNHITKTLSRRPRNTHKHAQGHVILAGGDENMMGAIVLSCKAALRAGAGVVSAITRKAHASFVTLAQPELMVHGSERPSDWRNLLTKATAIGVGPGLGSSNWSENVYNTIIDTSLPLVIDADGLNHLARHPIVRGDWIITPHAGEAARLLGTTTLAVQNDRFAAAKALQEKYAATVILKGCGTIIATTTGEFFICPYDTPAMATAGMGDILTGIVTAFLAQGLSLDDAAKSGVLAHGLAAQKAAGQHSRGLIASDVIDMLPGFLP